MSTPRNILILSGSPRKGGNTDLLAEAFAKGARESGHTLTVFNVGRKKINGCRACQKCYSKGQACVFNDDFNELAPMLEQAELLVLATPLYWFSFPAQIKAAIDKMYALYVGGHTPKIKEIALLVCAETDEMTDFDGIVRSYELICNYLKWEDRGRLLVPKVNLVGDILKTDALKQGEEMGRNI